MKDPEELFSVSIPQLIERYKIGEELNGNFIIVSDVQSYIDVLGFPLRIDALILCITQKGTVKATVNLREWVLTENDCFISLPENVIGVREISYDYQGAIIAISLDYLKQMNISLKDIMPYYVSVRNYPYVTLAKPEMKRLEQLYELITVTLKDKDSTRKEDIIKGLFSALVYILLESFDRIKNKPIKTKSKEYYFIRFMEALFSDFRLVRNVAYYSEKLAITPKYLSALIKEVSGISAAGWIDEYTIMEASILLKFSDKNIQQIADDLNFPNQSFFSKYFKHHTGEAPSEYRKRK